MEGKGEGEQKEERGRKGRKEGKEGEREGCVMASGGMDAPGRHGPLRVSGSKNEEARASVSQRNRRL